MEVQGNKEISDSGGTAGAGKKKQWLTEVLVPLRHMVSKVHGLLVIRTIEDVAFEDVNFNGRLQCCFPVAVVMENSGAGMDPERERNRKEKPRYSRAWLIIHF